MPGRTISKPGSAFRRLIGNSGAILDSPIAYNVHNRSRFWNNTPGFAASMRLKERGVLQLLPVNSYEDYNTWLTPDNSQLVAHQVVGGNIVSTAQIQGCLMSNQLYDWNTSLNDIELTQCYDKAYSKLRERMNGSNFNVPVFLAEARKTAGMVAAAATTMASAFNASAKRRNKKNGKRNIENTWLEYRYGWRLLVKDIVSALNTLHDLRMRGIYERVKVTGTTQWSGTFQMPSGSLWQIPGLLTPTRHEVHTYGVTITLLYRSDPVSQSLSQLGLTNPFILGWELLPYSFVIDWFTNVGAYLESLDLFIGKEFLRGSKSSWHQIEGTCTATVSLNAPWALGSFKTGVLGVKARRYKRDTLNSFPSASLPTFKPNLNTDRALDAIALLTQIGKGFRK